MSTLQLRLLRIFWVITALLAAIACSPSSFREKFRDERLSTDLIEATSLNGKVVRLSEFPGANLKEFVCVLEPYRDQVDTSYQNSDSINQKLKEAGFSASEGQWVVVRYRDTGMLRISAVHQTQRRLRESHGPSGAERRGLCGSIDEVLVDVSVPKEIEFYLEGEKR